MPDDTVQRVDFLRNRADVHGGGGDPINAIPKRHARVGTVDTGSHFYFQFALNFFVFIARSSERRARSLVSELA